MPTNGFERATSAAVMRDILYEQNEGLGSCARSFESSS